MEEDVEARGTPVPIPLKPGGALFMSNLCIHTSKLNTTQDCRWSIDFRYFPTPDRADLRPRQREAAEFVQNKILRGSQVPLIVLTKGDKPTWEEWKPKCVSGRKLWFRDTRCGIWDAGNAMRDPGCAMRGSGFQFGEIPYSTGC